MSEVTKPNSGQPTVFIVDDDAGIRSALSQLITSFGWTARAFDSAESFLDAYTPGCHQCLIVDLNLPGMNGAQLLAELAARDVQLPTVAITGRPDSTVANEAKRAGARAVLTKPFRSVQLRPVIEQAVHGCQATN